jgi:hypothetical protein
LGSEVVDSSTVDVSAEKHVEPETRVASTTRGQHAELAKSSIFCTFFLFFGEIWQIYPRSVLYINIVAVVYRRVDDKRCTLGIHGFLERYTSSWKRRVSKRVTTACSAPEAREGQRVNPGRVRIYGTTELQTLSAAWGDLCIYGDPPSYTTPSFPSITMAGGCEITVSFVKYCCK